MRAIIFPIMFFTGWKLSQHVQTPPVFLAVMILILSFLICGLCFFGEDSTHEKKDKKKSSTYKFLQSVFPLIYK